MPALPELRYVSSLQDPVAACLALVPAGARVASMDPSGDTALALVAEGAERVVVVAPDLASAALVHLKLAALRALPVQSVRSLFGVGTPGRRVWFYHHIRASLPEPARAWWDAREALVREGIIDGGRWELLLRGYRERVLKRTPGTAALARAFGDGAPDGRSAASAVDSLGWRLGTRLVFLGPIRSAQRLCGAHAPVAPFDARVRAVLGQGSPADNYQLVQLFLGAWTGASVAPPYLTPAGHARVAPHLSRVEVVVGRTLPAEEFDAVDLSLSVDELRASDRVPFLAEAATRLRPGGRIAGWWWNGSAPWTFADPRLLPDAPPAPDRSPFTGGMVAARHR